MSQGWAKILTREYLLEEHVDKKRSLREIAKSLGCTLGCIVRYVRKFRIPVNDPYYDIVGKKFGRLTVNNFANSDSNGQSYWYVTCDCGTKKVVQGKSLVRAAIVSCGCWNREKCWQGCGDLSKTYWSALVKGAARRHIDCDLTIEEGWALFRQQNGKCALTGRELFIDPQYARHHVGQQSIQTASLDRIDSSRGYIKWNVQWVHVKVNRMKWDLDQDEFVRLCREVVTNTPNRL